VSRAVFLDRDGVLNRAVIRAGKPHPPASSAELEIFPEAAPLLRRLKDLGLLLLVVTNQPDVGRGRQTRERVEEIHALLQSCLPIDDIFVCYHANDEDCICRKPKPGLLLQAARKYSIDLASSFLVGDRWRDVDAGCAAGCTAVWIDYGYDEPTPSAPHVRVNSLGEAVEWIVRQLQSRP
jgi:D-glycero-D-manno-heptose 1,7-bisphosphate phosphatase